MDTLTLEQRKRALEIHFAGMYDCALGQDNVYSYEELEKISDYANSLKQTNSDYTPEELEEMKLLGVEIISNNVKRGLDNDLIDLLIKAGHKLPEGQRLVINNPKSFYKLKTELKSHFNDTDFKITTATIDVNSRKIIIYKIPKEKK